MEKRKIEDPGLNNETAEAFGTYAEDKPVSKEEALDDLQSFGEMIAGGVPIAGDLVDAKDFAMAAKEGDVTGMALAGLGFVPFVGGMLKKGAKETMDLFRGADDVIQQEALRATAKDLKRIPNPENPDDVSALVQNARKIEENKILEYEAATKTEVPTGKVTEQIEDKAEMAKLLRARDADIEKLKSEGLGEAEFNARMKQITDKYKPAFQSARENRKSTVFHSNKTGDADKIEKEGLQQNTHTIMRGTTRDTTSFSSDPLYSAMAFGDNDAANTFAYKMSPEEVGNVRNVTPQEMDRASEVMDDRYYGADDTTAGIKLPEYAGYGHESETALFSVDKDRLTRLKTDDPAMYKFVSEGIDKAKKVKSDQSAIVKTLVDSLDKEDMSPAEARKLYTQIRDNMREGLSLAQYTSDNSARGTYDWYVRGWSDLGSSPVYKDGNPESATDILNRVLDEDMELASVYEDIISETPDLSDAEILKELNDWDESGMIEDAMAEAGDLLYIDEIDPDDIMAGLVKLQDNLVGEQNKDMIGKLIDSIDQYDTSRLKVKGKEGIIPTTEQMAEGGLVTK